MLGGSVQESWGVIYRWPSIKARFQRKMPSWGCRTLFWERMDRMVGGTETKTKKRTWARTRRFGKTLRYPVSLCRCLVNEVKKGNSKFQIRHLTLPARNRPSQRNNYVPGSQQIRKNTTETEKVLQQKLTDGYTVSLNYSTVHFPQ